MLRLGSAYYIIVEHFQAINVVPLQPLCVEPVAVVRLQLPVWHAPAENVMSYYQNTVHRCLHCLGLASSARNLVIQYHQIQVSEWRRRHRRGVGNGTRDTADEDSRHDDAHRFVPLGWFPVDWRNSPLGNNIRRYASWLRERQ